MRHSRKGASDEKLTVEKLMGYRCETCGELHDDLPDYGFAWPDYYFGVPEEEREQRISGTADTCRIDEHCFIRGVICVPITAEDKDFGLGVWVSQKPDNFQKYLDNPDSADIGPFFGWLSNRIPFYEEDTLNLQTRAVFQGRGQRPTIELAECEHQLYDDWSNGISLQQVLRMIHDH